MAIIKIFFVLTLKDGGTIIQKLKKHVASKIPYKYKITDWINQTLKKAVFKYSG